MELAYQTNPGLGTFTSQYNGNISAIKWASGISSAKQAYGFTYDGLNRLLGSTHYNAAMTADNSYQESMTYYLNGNINTLVRKGAAAAAIDNLTYGYASSNKSNQLIFVHDTGSATAGFVNGYTGDDDYSYDYNGNMTVDKNKGVTAITYNHLNLPVQVNKGSTDYIVYTYSAAGTKLSQQVYGTTPKTTDYIGEMVFEGSALQFINHAEGRVVMTGSTPEYQYHLKDHLGNVRVTVTSKEETEAVTATLETANQTAELANFLRYDNARRVQSAIFDHTNGSATGYAERLSGATNEKYGLARSLSVMPGDVVNVEVYAKYVDTNTANWTGALTTLIGQITSGAAGVVFDGTGYATSTSSFNGSWAALQSKSDNGAPKAYLNWLVFDRNYTFLNGGYKQITTAAKEAGSDIAHELMSSPAINITQAGYVYIYLSNENTSVVEVYFDDLKVTQTKSPLVQVQDYYPFGLSFNSYARENGVPDQYQYTGKEMQDELSLGWLDYGARMYMNDIGRWGVVDPLADVTQDWSPYNFTLNNPIRFIDPDGRMTLGEKWEEQNLKWGFSQLAECNGCSFGEARQSQNGKAESASANTTRPRPLTLNSQTRARRAQMDKSGGNTLESILDSQWTDNMKPELIPPNQNRTLAGDWTDYTGMALDAGDDMMKQVVNNFKLLQAQSNYFRLGLTFGKELGYANGVTTTMKWGGRGLGAYNAFKITEDYNAGKIGMSSLILEQATNAFSTLGGIYGAAWGVGWEIGRAITTIPSYQEWKHDTWLPWRKKKLGY